MEDQDLRDIGIGDPQHRRKLLQAARSLPKVSTRCRAPPGAALQAEETKPVPGTPAVSLGPTGNSREEQEVLLAPLTYVSGTAPCWAQGGCGSCQSQPLLAQWWR